MFERLLNDQIKPVMFAFLRFTSGRCALQRRPSIARDHLQLPTYQVNLNTFRYTCTMWKHNYFQGQLFPETMGKLNPNPNQQWRYHFHFGRWRLPCMENGRGYMCDQGTTV